MLIGQSNWFCEKNKMVNFIICCIDNNNKKRNQVTKWLSVLCVIVDVCYAPICRLYLKMSYDLCFKYILITIIFPYNKTNKYKLLKHNWLFAATNKLGPWGHLAANFQSVFNFYIFIHIAECFGKILSEILNFFFLIIRITNDNLSKSIENTYQWLHIVLKHQLIYKHAP